MKENLLLVAGAILCVSLLAALLLMTIGLFDFVIVAATLAIGAPIAIGIDRLRRRSNYGKQPAGKQPAENAAGKWMFVTGLVLMISIPMVVLVCCFTNNFGAIALSAWLSVVLGFSFLLLSSYRGGL